MFLLLALLPGLPALPTDSWFEYGDPIKPGLLVLCTVHAREWISAMACPWVARQLAVGDAAILQTYAVYIMPVVNPDGYAFSHEKNRYFRTNRRPGSYYGVDLNRNFPRHWNSCSQWQRCSSGSVGASSQTYPGTSGLVLFLDIHSFFAVVSVSFAQQGHPRAETSNTETSNTEMGREARAPPPG
ncbi:hypothetical protein EMIHUDRAFT_244883 [Emiliania huxleyi CCMP1516]|uniref:Peptidase M14 domain-containing protein n=2 Tax=Emiliania huxleyi TaxID=2903 RepID=A0A0D3IZC4_EMIH1|nr:hypothetical protein EMIHUDRAFT_244883 [Emiliania huxleyi CCMP1516]EOD16609.1 hypothetical protein EMIHUDRAFT_244883 [Emiliania huxleyi CCMP1516]|eukprot:XP_005769038.1 hypothetical protein EMIHUDRAFT_244883 [Emiliania huxleyi CCMP1516]